MSPWMHIIIISITITIQRITTIRHSAVPPLRQFFYDFVFFQQRRFYCQIKSIYHLEKVGTIVNKCRENTIWLIHEIDVARGPCLSPVRGSDINQASLIVHSAHGSKILLSKQYAFVSITTISFFCGETARKLACIVHQQTDYCLSEKLAIKHVL